MRIRSYGEDDRAVLTNQHIKADLKKTGNRHLLDAALPTPLLALLAFLLYIGAKSSWGENPGLFWFLVFFAALFAIIAVYLLVTSLCKAVPYLRAAACNRFFVTADKLISKEEGRQAPKSPSVYRSLRTKPNSYCFASGTCRVAVEASHYPHSEICAMNERTLFRHSEVGDHFLLVSLKPGKPVEIYPEKRFCYTDSSPL